MIRPVLPLLLLTLGLAACGSAEQSQRPSSGPLYQAEFQEAIVTGSALAAVRRLRPRWLNRGRRTVVYLDGNRAGRVSYLSTIPANAVVRLVHMYPGPGTARFGTGHRGRAILVFTH